MAVYKLTEEQRKQVAEILGVEDPETLSEKIYDHEEFSGVTKKRDEFKRKTSELQTQVEELQPRVLTEEDLAEYKNLKREKKERKTSQSDPSELDALRETLTAQHRQEIGVIESDRDFWKNLTESKLRDQELIVQASKLGFQDPNDALVLRNRIRIDVTGEGDSQNILVKVRDESGKAWFTNEGNEGTVEDLVKDLADRKPYLLKKDEERGSGAGGNNDDSKEKKTPRQQLDDLNQAYKAALSEGRTVDANNIEIRRSALRKQLRSG